jgi:UDP-N-acetylglucosamine 1-carboxyvinyltransferase
MEKLIIEGGHKLKGEVKISGAKNSALPILATSLLTEGWNTFYNIPNLRDITTIKTLLREFGAEIEDIPNGIRINASNLNSKIAPYELVKTMRASILVLGPLIARMKKAQVSMPGGCAIGERPINFHIKALKALGANVEIKHGYINAKASKLKGTTIYFDIPTVTGTENILMAAVTAKGTTILKNAACEPEVVDLCGVLNKMGARIEGAGTRIITIHGVKKLNPITYTIIPDRIETGTFMVAAGITRGEVYIRNANFNHCDAVTDKLREIGLEIENENGKIKIKGRRPPKCVNVKTVPYPGFSTDMQAQIMALMTTAVGSGIITETIFENRFMHVAELKRMGADIIIKGSNAIVKGVNKLSGAKVMATDLRASASLILAGLAAEGTTEIFRIYHIDRGYENIENKLSNLGAKIKRVKE